MSATIASFAIEWTLLAAVVVVLLVLDMGDEP